MAVVPVLPAIVAGGPYPTSSLSALIAAVDFLQRRPAAELRQTIVQSIPASTFTAILFDVEDLDKNPDGSENHSTSVNTSRFTAVYAGWLHISGAIGYAASAAGAARMSAIFVNGTALNGCRITNAPHATHAACVVVRTKSVFLNVGDYVEIAGFQDTGGALNTSVTADTQSSMTAKWERLA